MPRSKKDYSKEHFSAKAGRVDEKEEFNGQAQAAVRLRKLRNFLQGNGKESLIIPRIGILYPDLDIELMNRDLGWGHSERYDLSVLIRKTSNVCDLPVSKPNRDNQLQATALSITCQPIDTEASESSSTLASVCRFPVGSFDIFLGERGELLCFSIAKFSPKIERNEPDSVTITMTPTDQIDLLSPERNSTAKIKAAKTADRVITLISNEISHSREKR